MGQDNQIGPPFQGSPIGTTIPNLQPGNYQVNELKIRILLSRRVGRNADPQIGCLFNGFDVGGQSFASLPGTICEDICFEYEDEQGK